VPRLIYPCAACCAPTDLPPCGMLRPDLIRLRAASPHPAASCTTCCVNWRNRKNRRRCEAFFLTQNTLGHGMPCPDLIRLRAACRAPTDLPLCGMLRPDLIRLRAASPHPAASCTTCCVNWRNRKNRRRCEAFS
jgi:hypothetical protein